LLDVPFSTQLFSFQPTQSGHFSIAAVIGEPNNLVHRVPMSESSFLCQQLPWPAFAYKQAMGYGLVEQYPMSLVGKVGTQTGVVVPHEPGRVEVVPDQTVASSMAFDRSILMQETSLHVYENLLSIEPQRHRGHRV
jgi:hypothetical protein